VDGTPILIYGNDRLGEKSSARDTLNFYKRDSINRIVVMMTSEGVGSEFTDTCQLSNVSRLVSKIYFSLIIIFLNKLNNGAVFHSTIHNIGGPQYEDQKTFVAPSALGHDNVFHRSSLVFFSYRW
jgi:hypothetical protein